MKPIEMNPEMNPIEVQERRAQQHFNGRAAFYAGLVAGAIFLIVSRGIPWFSTGVSDTVMGRPVFPAQAANHSLYLVGAVHMLVSFCYAFIISAIIFRLRPLPAILTGGGVGLVLYGMNYLLFRVVLNHDPNFSELPVAITHVAFALFASAIYKAISVPRIGELHKEERPS